MQKLLYLTAALIIPAQLAAQTPTARKQIDDVVKQSAHYASVDSAKANGFNPVFGWLPTMGTHWVNPSLLFDRNKLTIATPSNLMFSPMHGKDTLVGVAYAYFAKPDSITNVHLFDGDPAWHDHPDLAPEGSTLAMLHVWLVPSPDGPFAPNNPNLPFWALNIEPPKTFTAEARKAALALGEIVDSAGLFPRVAARAAVAALLTPERNAVRALIPQLQKNPNDAATLSQLAAHWDAIRSIYLTAIKTPEINQRVTNLMDGWEGTGEHHHH